MKKPTRGAGPIAPRASVAQVVQRQKYYMIAGEIVFRAEGEEIPHSIRANGVVMSSDGKFAVPQIARAQQTLQHVFHQRMGEDAKIQVLDVVILAIMPLGEMTPEEFNKPVPAAPMAPPPAPANAPANDAPAADATIEGVATDTPIPVTDIPVEEVVGTA